MYATMPITFSYQTADTSLRYLNCETAQRSYQNLHGILYNFATLN